MTFLRIVTAVALLAGASLPAAAAVVTLDFEGINTTYPTSDWAFVNDFYNGGTSSAGTSGPNAGIGITDALAICLNKPDTLCSNVSRGGQGDPDSQTTGLLFSGSNAFVNVTAGFKGGLSLFYAGGLSPEIAAIFGPASIQLFDGLNGTGNSLATLSLPKTLATCSGLGDYCPFVPTALSFTGTAKSISFMNARDQIVFDDVTFDNVLSGPVNPVPVPASLPLLLAGTAGLAALRRRRGD